VVSRPFVLNVRKKSMQPRCDQDACLTAKAPQARSGARIEETPLRTRIALSLGALLLAGGAAFTGTALAQQPTAPPTITLTERPPAPPTAEPAPPRPTTTRAAPGEPGKVTRKPDAPERRVPTAIPAGPTGDLNLPDVVEGAGH
jgi:hypothetical protein